MEHNPESDQDGKANPLGGYARCYTRHKRRLRLRYPVAVESQSS